MDLDARCDLCNQDNPDSFHYILSCPYFTRVRKKKLSTSLPVNILSYKEILNINNLNIAKFAREIMLVWYNGIISTDIAKELPYYL